MSSAKHSFLSLSGAIVRLSALSVTGYGDLLDFGHLFKPLATINTFLGNFCKGVKIFNFSSEIIFGQLL